MIVDLWRVAGVKGSRVAAIPNARAFGQPGLTAGLPDLICYGGRYHKTILFIELKTAKGKLSSFQRIILQELTDAGFHAIVCRSFEEARDTLEAFGIVRPQVARQAE